MRLRSLLGLFAVGMAFLPLSLAPMAGLLLGSARQAASPLAHHLRVMRVVQASVEVGPDGALVPVPDADLPEWLELVVADADGRIVLSTFPEFAPGDPAGSPSLTSLSGTLMLGYRYVADTISAGGGVVGAYAARFRSSGLTIAVDPAWQFLTASMLLILAILAFSAGGVISTRLVRAFRSLEKAAERIAEGDLESAVTAGGIREITALASAMESMRESLRENSSRRARFIAGVSHDLRTPLTGIRGYLEAVQDGMAEDPETLGRYISIIGDKTAILEDRITELLEFARLETGEWRLRLSELRLGPFLERLASGYTEDARAAGRMFTARLSGLEGLTIRADELTLARALENIFTNALRYAPEGSRITLASRRGDGAVILEFEDDGPGIPEPELSGIFEPYFRGSSSSGDRTGLGLGLSIARSIIRDHGWELTAGSRPGGGSRFAVRIDPAS